MKRPNYPKLSLLVPEDDDENDKAKSYLHCNNDDDDNAVVDYTRGVVVNNEETTAPSTSSATSTSYSSQGTGESDDDDSSFIDNKSRQRRLSTIRIWQISFKRSMKRRARRALREKQVPNTLHPFLDMLLKQPDQILYSPYSLRIGRICLMLSSIALVAGKNWTSVIVSIISFMIFRLAKKISQCIFLDKWVYISLATLITSIITLLCLTLSFQLSRLRWHHHYQEIATTLWLVGYFLQKLCGYLLGYYMYRHVENLHFLEIHIKILEFRSSSTTPVSKNLSSSSTPSKIISPQQQHRSSTTTTAYSRHHRKNSSSSATYEHQHVHTKFPIDLYHGGAKLARTNDQALKKIKFSVLSLSLQEHKYIKCYVFNTPPSSSPRHNHNHSPNSINNNDNPVSSSEEEENVKEKEKQQHHKKQNEQSQQPKHHHRKREIIGIANIPIPEMRNVKMTNLFDVVNKQESSKNNNNICEKGQLLVEIEIR